MMRPNPSEGYLERMSRGITAIAEDSAGRNLRRRLLDRPSLLLDHPSLCRDRVGLLRKRRGLRLNVIFGRPVLIAFRGA